MRTFGHFCWLKTGSGSGWMQGPGLTLHLSSCVRTHIRRQTDMVLMFLLKNMVACFNKVFFFCEDNLKTAQGAFIICVPVCVSTLRFRWRCPRTLWCVQKPWAGPNMAAAASSSSWAGWACCLVYTDSSPVADELLSLDTELFSSRSFPSWWRRHRATASGDEEQLIIITSDLKHTVVNSVNNEL